MLRHQFQESSRQLKEQMREAFDKDDRYCATGDEKYYLDLPGKENEKVLSNQNLYHTHHHHWKPQDQCDNCVWQVLMSEVRRFSRDFDPRQLTKTLTLKFERLTLC